MPTEQETAGMLWQCPRALLRWDCACAAPAMGKKGALLQVEGTN